MFDMAWRIFLFMSWNIVLKIEREIMLETNVFDFYSDNPFYLTANIPC